MGEYFANELSNDASGYYTDIANGSKVPSSVGEGSYLTCSILVATIVMSKMVTTIAST